MLRQAQHEDFSAILTLSLSKGELAARKAREHVQWTCESSERRELQASGRG